MKTKPLSLFLCLCLCLLSLSTRADDLTVDNTVRNYLKYIPENLGKKRPLLISCHGMNQDAAYQKSMLAIENIADTAKFAVVFPNGIGKAWDISGNRDLNFILAIIDKMVTEYDIDRNRVYLSGFSMGGMLTYHAMNKIADKIAAFAPISGYPLGGGNYTSARPVPIIHTHGTGDDVVNFGGVANVLAGWVKRNNCPPTEVKTARYRGANHITRHQWGPGDNGVEVVLMELADKGHWISNDMISTGEEIWKFCRRYALDMKDPSVTIVTPTSGTSYTSIGTSDITNEITVKATATDPDGYVAKVDFYDGTALVATVDKAPYTCTLHHLAAGNHQIKAVVTDDEGRSSSSMVSLIVNHPDAQFLITDNFTTSGSVPAGWMVSDGNETRVGYSDGYGNGCRLFTFTGTPRSFDTGLYIRNVTGGTKQGVARYASAETNAHLTLAPGVYQILFMVANWNNNPSSPVTCCLTDRITNEDINGYTVMPTANIGNSANNSFSGATLHEYFFEIKKQGDYGISFYTNDGMWADAVIGKVLIAPSKDALAQIKAHFYQALFEARALAASSSDPVYAGDTYTALQSAINHYASFTATSAEDYQQAVSALEKAIKDMQQYKLAVDATKHDVIVYENDFTTQIGNVPHGWITFDGAEKRIGEQISLGLGCRVLPFTGTPRDFDAGLYIRNASGVAGGGYALLGSVEGDSLLTLVPGKYTLSFSLSNWNCSAQPVRLVVSRASATTTPVIDQTYTPNCNIGNNTGNSFSGTTQVVIDFDVAVKDNYMLAFYTADGAWTDAVIAKLKLWRTEYTSTGIQPVRQTEVKRVVYHTLNGMVSDVSAKGIYLKTTIFTDGRKQTVKGIKR